MLTDILIATTNPGKEQEMRELFRVLPVKIYSLSDLGLSNDIPETGSTYHENASIKAKAWALQSGYPTIGDDSGLEVEALDGAPGLFSARYHPQPGAGDADRREYLLKALFDKSRPWKARFVCALVLALPSGIALSAEGICRGEIIQEERGSNGFGYDPIFLVEGSRQTMAELDSAYKNTISHRARAAAELIQKIRLEGWTVL